MADHQQQQEKGYRIAETSGEEDVKLLMFLHRNFLAGHLSSSVLTEIFFVTTRDHSMIGMRALVFLMAEGILLLLLLPTITID